MLARRKLVLERFLPYRLSLVSNIVSATVATAYQSLFDLTIPQWRLVAVIAEANFISQQEIGHRTRMDKVTVSRAAVVLVDRKLVKRTPNPHDQRSQLLELSPSGRKLYLRVAPKALAIERDIFGGFSDAEIRNFVVMLERIDAAAGALEVTNDRPKEPRKA